MSRKPLVDFFEEHMDKIVHELGLKSYSTTKQDNIEAGYYELSIVHPAVNLYLHFLSGALNSLETSNIIVIFSSLRGMLESIATIAYFEDKDPNNLIYNKFLNKGRLYRKDSSRWREISKREQIKSIENLTGKKLVGLYDVLCSSMHFTNLHFCLTLDDMKEIDKGGIVTRIGMDKLDREAIIDVLNTIEDLGEELRLVLVKLSKVKQENTAGVHRFKYSPLKDNLFPKDYIEYLRADAATNT